MMHEFFNLNWFNQALGTSIRSNGLQNNTRICSTSKDAINHSKFKSFRLSRSLIDDSGFAIALIIMLVCGMIQRKYHEKSKVFIFLQKIHSLQHSTGDFLS